jgi:hypothetical protein
MARKLILLDAVSRTSEGVRVSERCIIDTIDQALKIIPNNERLVDEFLHIRNSALYTAPELMYLRWTQGTAAITERFPDPSAVKTGGWGDKLITLWSTNPNWRDRV